MERYAQSGDRDGCRIFADASDCDPNCRSRMTTRAMVLPDPGVNIPGPRRAPDCARARRALLPFNPTSRPRRVAVSSDACRSDASRNDGNRGVTLRPLTNHATQRRPCAASNALAHGTRLLSPRRRHPVAIRRHQGCDKNAARRHCGVTAASRSDSAPSPNTTPRLWSAT